jgi:putative oxidoreductase
MINPNGESPERGFPDIANAPNVWMDRTAAGEGPGMFNILSRYQPQLLALLRIVAGLLFLEHGLVKLIGFPPGAPPGLQAPLSFLGIAGIIEAITGILIVLGLFTRPAAFIAAGEMAVAYWYFHAPQGLFPVLNMGEGAILFCFIFLYLAAAGPGAFSLDGMRARR